MHDEGVIIVWKGGTKFVPILGISPKSHKVVSTFM